MPVREPIVVRPAQSVCNTPAPLRLPDVLKPFKAIIHAGWTTPIEVPELFETYDYARLPRDEIDYCEFADVWHSVHESKLYVPRAALNLQPGDWIRNTQQQDDAIAVPQGAYCVALERHGIKYCHQHKLFHPLDEKCTLCPCIIVSKHTMGCWPKREGTLFGVEFEYCTNHNIPITNFSRWVAANFVTCGDAGCAEELDTLPLTWEEATSENMKAFITYYRYMGASAWRKDCLQAGMHIHINRDQLSEDQYELIKKWFRYHHEEVRAISGRTQDFSWRYAWTTGGGTKYKPIHDHHLRLTWEVRLFSARLWTDEEFGWNGYMFAMKFVKSLTNFQSSDIGMSIRRWINERCDLTESEQWVVNQLYQESPRVMDAGNDVDLNGVISFVNRLNDTNYRFIVRCEEKMYSFESVSLNGTCKLIASHSTCPTHHHISHCEFIDADEEFKYQYNSLLTLLSHSNLPIPRDW